MGKQASLLWLSFILFMQWPSFYYWIIKCLIWPLKVLASTLCYALAVCVIEFSAALIEIDIEKKTFLSCFYEYKDNIIPF